MGHAVLRLAGVISTAANSYLLNLQQLGIPEDPWRREDVGHEMTETTKLFGKLLWVPVCPHSQSAVSSLLGAEEDKHRLLAGGTIGSFP